MGNLFTTSLLLLMKMVSLGAVAMISLKRKLLLAISTPFSQHLPENSIFGHFSPFTQGPPFDQPLLLLTKLLSLGAVAMISKKREQLHANTTPFSRHLPENFHFWSFLAIFHHLCLLMGDPLIPPLHLLTKMLSLSAVAMKSTEMKLLQAITTIFSRHLPENSIFGHFWPFSTLCAHSWVTP